MSMNEIDRTELEQRLKKSLKDHWQLFLGQGIVLIVLGLVAIALPQVASIAVTAFVGWLLFIVGAVRTVSLVRAIHAPGYWASLALAILTAVLGLVLALFPVPGAQTFTLLLVFYFVLHGSSSLSLAFAVRGDTSRWVLLLLTGLIDFVLAIFILAGLPDTALWVLGLYFGISLTLTGGALISAALHARSAA